MSRIRYIAIGLPVLALVAIVSAPLVMAEPRTQARLGIDANTQNARIAEKRAAIQEKLAQMKQARTERLDARRVETCEKREAKINEIVQRRSEQGTRHLAVFTKIAERVQEFITDKNLTIPGYDELVQNIDDKEAAATAAIEANTANTFSCDEADASDPAKLPTASIAGIRDALKDSRTAIKDLIVQVKANAANRQGSDQNTEGTSETETETESETETDNGGEQ